MCAAWRWHGLSQMIREFRQRPCQHNIVQQTHHSRLDVNGIVQMVTLTSGTSECVVSYNSSRSTYSPYEMHILGTLLHSFTYSIIHSLETTVSRRFVLCQDCISSLSVVIMVQLWMTGLLRSSPPHIRPVKSVLMYNLRALRCSSSAQPIPQPLQKHRNHFVPAPCLLPDSHITH